MKKTLTAFALVLIINPSFAAPPKQAAKDDGEILVTKTLLEKRLKDPLAIQYKGVNIVIKKSGSKAVCGEYNAKNSFGGYVGFRPFMRLLEPPTEHNPALWTTYKITNSMEDDVKTYQRFCLTDEMDATLAKVEAQAKAKDEADRAEMRKTRRENIERNCAEKRKEIDDAGGSDMQAKKVTLEQSCADAVRASDAN